MAMTGGHGTQSPNQGTNNMSGGYGRYGGPAGLEGLVSSVLGIKNAPGDGSSPIKRLLSELSFSGCLFRQRIWDVADPK